MLHTVNKSPFMHNNLESCLKYASDGDTILLYEDGVIGAQKGSKVESLIIDAAKKCTVYVLSEDLKARGVSDLVDGVQTTDYSGFVDLVEKSKQLAWL